MAYTLAQVDNLTTDLFIKGVALDVVRENPILSMLPFMTAQGKQVTYNRQSTTGSQAAWKTATFTQIGGAVPESTPSTGQVSTTLAQLVDSAKVARFAISVKGDINPILQFNNGLKISALFETFQDALFYGDNAANSNEFSGLHKLVDNTLDTDLDITEAASALNIVNLLQMADAVRSPSLYLSNRRIAARMSQAQWLGGTVGTATVQNISTSFGARIKDFGGTPWLVSDYLTMTETDADPPVESGSSNASVFAIKLDAYPTMGGDGVLYSQGPTIIQSPEGPFILDPMPIPGESSVAIQYYWFVALIVPSRRTVGRLRGITAAAIAA